MEGLDFSIVAPYSALLLRGTWLTVAISVEAALLSLAAGLLFAVTLLYLPRLIQYPVRFFMWLFMGTPLLLQLFVIYFGLVQVGLDIPAFGAGVIGLGLHFAVYNADVFRAGLVAVDPGQTEAGRTLGLGRWRTLRYIVVPQVIQSTLPTIGSNMIALLKESAIVSMIGINVLVYATQLAISETYRPFEFYLVAGLIYYLLNIVLEVVLHRMERRVELTR